MTSLVDVRADAIFPGESIWIGGALILVTAVDCQPAVVDLHTEYGPALRMARGELVAVAIAADAA